MKKSVKKLNKGFTPIKSGFTLIEFLIFMSVLSTLLLVLGNTFGSIIDSQLESKAYSSVDMDGRYILAKLSHDLQNADSIHDSIVLPAVGSTGSTLKININSVDYIYDSSGSGNLQLTLNQGSIPDQLNSSDSSISALLFQRMGPGGSKDTIRVSFRLTGRTMRQNIKEIRDFVTTLSMP